MKCAADGEHLDLANDISPRRRDPSETISSLNNDETPLIDVAEAMTPSSAALPVHVQPTLQKLYSMLDNGSELSDDVETLHSELRALRTEVGQLRKADLPGTGTEVWPTLHSVACPISNTSITYLDCPSYTWEKQHDHLQGHRIVQQTSWEQRHPERPFVVYLGYDCIESKKKRIDSAVASLSRNTVREGAIATIHESVRITSALLLDSLKKFFDTSPTLKAYWTGGVMDNTQSFHKPYYFFYHFGDLLRAFKASLHENARQIELGVFIEYLSAQSAHINQRIATSIASRKIRLSHLPFLFAPGVLIVSDHDGIHSVVCQKSVIRVQVASSAPSPSMSSGDGIVNIFCSMDVSEVQFDGRFWAREKSLRINLLKGRGQLITFDELDHLPLALSSTASRELLIRRGRTFFNCRSGLYVTSDADATETSFGGVRYMIDADAYRIVHQHEEGQQQAHTKSDGAEELFPGDEPDENFLLQLPPRIPGFNMQEKSWTNILAAGIKPVVWDKEAFGNLAIESDTKELIQALVRNKIKADQSIDFVKGKGTGLIVLLHGGPGTGKTLTAETVAEIAERPLYRVTCGAMGTTAKEVEKNLESVFHLGRRWGCVVLLDEADVFLEQRSLSDLSRNALVSVFLRVIEYFDGIMILTSNRVATFDEAFKSRIQLALQYRALDPDQRLQVWQNFIRNLELVAEPVAIENIKSHTAELSGYNMNGRQIRNAINTARQLARFKGEPLNIEHLRRVIQVSGRFDDYVRGVNEVKDDEQWARENSLR